MKKNNTKNEDLRKRKKVKNSLIYQTVKKTL